MNIFAKHIELTEKLNVSVLSNRATARTLFKKEIKNVFYPSIIIDFKNIEFASRSFLDELNSLISDKRFGNVQKMNMNEQVSRMDELVTSARETIDKSFKHEKSESTFMTV